MANDQVDGLRGIDWSGTRGRQEPLHAPVDADAEELEDFFNGPTGPSRQTGWASSPAWSPGGDGNSAQAPRAEGQRALDDLFAPDGPTAPLGVQTADTVSGLSELFGEEQESAPAASSAGPADALANVFGDEEPAGSSSLSDLFDESVGSDDPVGTEDPDSEELGSAAADLEGAAPAAGAALAGGEPPVAHPSIAPPEDVGDTPDTDAGAQRVTPEAGWAIPGARRRLRLPGRGGVENPELRDSHEAHSPDGAIASEDGTANAPLIASRVAASGAADAQPGDDSPEAGAQPPTEGARELTVPRESVADRVARARDAGLVTSDAATLKAAAAINEERLRYEDLDRLYILVNQILGIVAGEPKLHHLNRMLLTRDATLDRRQRQQFQEAIAPHLVDSGIRIQVPAEIPILFDLAYDEMIGIGPLGGLWRNDAVTDILVDAWNRVSVESGGHLIDTPVRFRDADHARTVARNLAQKISDRALSDQSPLVTAELPGARVTFAIGSIVRSGLSISLRKGQPLMGMGRLLEIGSLSPAMRDFLSACVVARATILVSGGTGTGKTTIINALSESIPSGERVVTIEDSFELALANHHVVSLQTKERASADDEVRVTQEMLLINTLRMRPDRVIVGEIRESEGARVMLQAANTGHDGTMTTIHANSPEAALNDRLADMLRGAKSVPDDVAKREVAMAIDLVVHVNRRQGIRYVSAISAVDRSSLVSDARSATVRPTDIFIGELTTGPDGAPVPVYRQVGGIRTDTDLGVKLVDAGFDVSQWELRS